MNDLLDYGAIETGSLRMERRREPAADIARDAAERAAMSAREQEITIATELDEPLPEVLCDRERVRQALQNLVGNAVKFSPSGTRVVLSCRRQKEGVCFLVEDEGAGIADSEQAHVFDRYYRGAAARGRGRGLGLPIVKGIVEGHGGSVGVTSALGKGSRFWFWLPALS
ncbi:MAG TPA: HAMP domain-containing sensor histidine kinase [Polyangiaceae bacterium]